jgi:hypothetical protein
MRCVPVILIILMTVTSLHGREETGPSPRFMIGAEYRQDALDYDNVDKRFFRETALLTFGKSSASFTHVNVGMTRENRFTGNICISGLSPYFECIVGNYYANFGAGLLVGRKMAISPDQFSRSLAVSRGTPFSPCTTGNPYFSFQGVAAGARYASENFSFSLYGYYSFRNRFVRNDRQYPDNTGTSLNSILIRTKKDYRYSDPVEINDCGYSLVLQIVRHVTLQSYFIYTFIKRSNNHFLVWNFDSTMIPGGEKYFFGYGFYFQYSDDYIQIFIDLCFPNRIVTTAVCGPSTSRGFGIMYSLAFRNRLCSLSFTGKQTDKNFYSPYSSGRSYPETAVMTAFSIRPLKYFSMGSSFFLEKNRLPSLNEQYLRFTSREQLFLKYDMPLKGSCSVRLAFAETGRKNGMERQLRLMASSKMYVLKSIIFSWGGTMLRSSSGRYSGSINASVRLALFNSITLNIRYSRFFIAPGDIVYTPASRPADSIRSSMDVRSSSNILAGGLRARFRGCMFSVEYFHQFEGVRTFQSRIEASFKFIL